ncbi:MAG: type II secretion system protein GspE, partial [Polyangiaceae bacterium]
MQQAQQEFLAEVLTRRGVVPADKIAPLIAAAIEKGQPITELVVAADLAPEVTIAQAFAEEWGLGFMKEIDVNAVPLS